MQDFDVIIWDFDGVIILSNEVREAGFREIFKAYPEELINRLLEYHRLNGGLSRYVKIRYFFEELLGKQVDNDTVLAMAEQFSVVMKQKLVDKTLLNDDWTAFMASSSGGYIHHIASGSDGNELRMLCKALDIEHFFGSIGGSPVQKNQLVAEILDTNSYDRSRVVLIGDSINDYEAARVNEIAFRGYNNEALAKMADYIDHLKEWGKEKNI